MNVHFYRKIIFFLISIRGEGVTLTYVIRLDCFVILVFEIKHPTSDQLMISSPSYISFSSIPMT